MSELVNINQALTRQLNELERLERLLVAMKDPASTIVANVELHIIPSKETFHNERLNEFVRINAVGLMEDLIVDQKAICAASFARLRTAMSQADFPHYPDDQSGRGGVS